MMEFPVLLQGLIKIEVKKTFFILDYVSLLDMAVIPGVEDNVRMFNVPLWTAQQHLTFLKVTSF
jgi:hypothetical protein